MILSKILPVKYPYITSFPSHANLISILSNNEEYLPWLYNYYIQLEISRDIYPEMKLDFAVGSATGHLKNCPYISFHGINRDFIQVKWSSLSDFLVDCINQDYYLYLLIDSFYIPGYESYQHKHLPHDIMIYGYDKEKEIFNVADFFKASKYEYLTARFSEVETAYKGFDSINQGDWLEGVILLSEKNKARSGYNKYTFDIGFVADLIRDYLSSQNPYYRNRYIRWRLDNSQWAFGLEIYTKLREYIERITMDGATGQNLFHHIRSFHVLYDHKIAILRLIRYLGENNYLKDADEIYQRYSKLKEIALQARNSMIKYTIKSDKHILTNISHLLSNMLTEEEIIFKHIIDNLRPYPEFRRI